MWAFAILGGIVYAKKAIDTQTLKEYLSSPLKESSPELDISPSANQQAKALLLETLRRAKQMQHRTGHVHIELYDRPFHDCNSEYLRSMLRIKRDLAQQQWNAACNDLQDVLHFYQINDGRILNEIIQMLEGYLL